jgi:hypothetical protein
MVALSQQWTEGTAPERSFRLYGQGTFRIDETTGEPNWQVPLSFDAPLAHFGAPRGIRFKLNNSGTELHPPGRAFPPHDGTRFEVTGTASTATYIDDTTVRLDGAYFDSVNRPTYEVTATGGDIVTIGDTIYGATGANQITLGRTDYTTSGTITVNTQTGEWALQDFVPHGGLMQRANPREAKRWRLRQQHLSYRNVRGGDRACFANASPAELVALQLLRKMVKPDVFKHYLKYGFVVVRGPSGLEYQVQRKSHMIQVRDRGQKVASLCVYVQGPKIPPTDDVVAKLIIIECDEPDIWKRANVSWNHRVQRERYQERIAA